MVIVLTTLVVALSMIHVFLLKLKRVLIPKGNSKVDVVKVTQSLSGFHQLV